MKDNMLNEYSFIFENTEHVLTSLIECTLLTKTELSSVLESSLCIAKAKKKKRTVNMIKIHILELAIYALSSMKTLQETRGKREGS